MDNIPVNLIFTLDENGFITELLSVSESTIATDLHISMKDLWETKLKLNGGQLNLSMRIGFKFAYQPDDIEDKLRISHYLEPPFAANTSKSVKMAKLNRTRTTKLEIPRNPNLTLVELRPNLLKKLNLTKASTAMQEKETPTKVVTQEEEPAVIQEAETAKKIPQAAPAPVKQTNTEPKNVAQPKRVTPLEEEIVTKPESTSKIPIQWNWNYPTINIDDDSDTPTELSDGEVEIKAEEHLEDEDDDEKNKDWFDDYKEEELPDAEPWWDINYGKKSFEEHECDICGQPVCEPNDAKYYKLKEHYRQFHNACNILCDICGIQYSYRQYNDTFKYHYMEHFPSTKKFPCQQCPEVFGYKHKLARHLRSKHLARKPSKPPTKKIFYCDLCGRALQCKGTLVSHMKRFHMTAAPTFACTECYYKTATYKSLEAHVKSKHRAEAERPVACKLCGKRFAWKLALKRHMLVHSNVRRYVCDLCGRGYKQSCDLKNHMTIHTGELYSCLFCDMKFTDRGNKNAHQRRKHPVQFADYKEAEALRKLVKN